MLIPSKVHNFAEFPSVSFRFSVGNYVSAKDKIRRKEIFPRKNGIDFHEFRRKGISVETLHCNKRYLK